MSAHNYFPNLPSKGRRYLRMTKEQKLQVRFLTPRSRHISMMPLFAVWWDPIDQFHTAISVAAKTHQELLARAKHNWSPFLLKEVASTFFFPMPQALIINPIPKPVSLFCKVDGNSNLFSLQRSHRKFALVPVSPEFMASYIFPPLQCLLEDLSSVTASGQQYCST